MCNPIFFMKNLSFSHCLKTRVVANFLDQKISKSSYFLQNILWKWSDERKRSFFPKRNKQFHCSLPQPSFLPCCLLPGLVFRHNQATNRDTRKGPPKPGRMVTVTMPTYASNIFEKLLHKDNLIKMIFRTRPVQNQDCSSKSKWKVSITPRKEFKIQCLSWQHTLCSFSSDATMLEAMWVKIEHPNKCQWRYCGLKYDVNANLCDVELPDVKLQQEYNEKCHVSCRCASAH